MSIQIELHSIGRKSNSGSFNHRNSVKKLRVNSKNTQGCVFITCPPHILQKLERSSSKKQKLSPDYLLDNLLDSFVILPKSNLKMPLMLLIMKRWY